MKEIEFITSRKTEFLKYLKSKFTLIHMSNIFFRDFHYGVMSYLQEHGMKVKYLAGEQISRHVGEEFEKQNIFRKIDHQSWLLNYAEFALPRVEKKAP